MFGPLAKCMKKWRSSETALTSLRTHSDRLSDNKYSNLGIRLSVPIEIDTIISKIEWAAARGLSDFAVTSSGARIRIKRGSTPTGAAVQSVVAPTSVDVTAQPSSAQTIDAPMAGICYLASDSDSAPFISVGDTVEVGQTICIIEAMKVMTSITATKAGTVKAILIEDGTSVSAGVALIEVAQS